MDQANCVFITPPTNAPISQTILWTPVAAPLPFTGRWRRRRWRRPGAGDKLPAPAAAAPAGLLDPVFGLIEAYRTARGAYLVALAGRLDVIDDLSADWEYVTDADEFNDLIETAPTTFAGLVAWASYLDEFGKVEV